MRSLTVKENNYIQWDSWWVYAWDLSLQRETITYSGTRGGYMYEISAVLFDSIPLNA